MKYFLSEFYSNNARTFLRLNDPDEAYALVESSKLKDHLVRAHKVRNKVNYWWIALRVALRFANLFSQWSLNPPLYIVSSCDNLGKAVADIYCCFYILSSPVNLDYNYRILRNSLLFSTTRVASWFGAGWKWKVYV